MENPYQTPESVLKAGDDGVFQKASVDGTLIASIEAQSALFRSKGWVKFNGVLGIIYFAFIILITLFFGIYSLFIGSLMPFLLILIPSSILFILAKYLLSYSRCIGITELTRDAYDLELVMYYQMKFWRLAGILLLIGLGLLLVSGVYF